METKDITAKQYSILENRLYADVDTMYDSDANKIDVYSSVSWSAETERDYKDKEELIDSWSVENELFKAYAWCDISGFDYWVIQQEEPNYVSIDFELKKQPEEYTQEEMQQIRDAIIKADQYFEEKLNN